MFIPRLRTNTSFSFGGIDVSNGTRNAVPITNTGVPTGGNLSTSAIIVTKKQGEVHNLTNKAGRNNRATNNSNRQAIQNGQDRL